MSVQLSYVPDVFGGPRIERRRVLSNGSAYWGTLINAETLRLDDGRAVRIADVTHLPPC